MYASFSMCNLTSKSLTDTLILVCICYRFLYLDETFSPVQLVGAIVTVAAIYLVNFQDTVE